VDAVQRGQLTNEKELYSHDQYLRHHECCDKPTSMCRPKHALLDYHRSGEHHPLNAEKGHDCVAPETEHRLNTLRGNDKKKAFQSRWIATHSHSTTVYDVATSAFSPARISTPSYSGMHTNQD
jgi:hypothetical protein